MPVQPNAIMSRMGRMQQLWRDALTTDPSVICWQLKTVEEDFADMFYLLEETGEYSEFPEVFIKFDAPFTSPETFAEDLSRQLVQAWEASSEHYQPEELCGLENWHLLDEDVEQKTGTWFLQQVQFLKNCMKSYPWDKIVVYIAPQQISDYQQWSKWVENTFSKPVPSGLLVMLKDYREYPYLEKPLGEMGKKACILKADLDLFGAMKQEAAAGATHDPGVQYRVAFLEMAEAAGKEDEQGVLSAGDKCLSIARDTKLSQLEAAAMLAMGTHLLNLGNWKKALKVYRDCLDFCEQQKSTETPGDFVRISMQAHAAIASVFLLENKYMQAAASYGEMGQCAFSLKDMMNQMEAHRMEAYCYEQKRKFTEALTSIKAAFEAGKALPRETLPFTTFPHICSTLLDLAKRFEPSQQENYRDEIKTLLGEDWRHGHRKVKA